MITTYEAERLVRSFLIDSKPPKLPENFAFDVIHNCGWSCRGSYAQRCVYTIVMRVVMRVVVRIVMRIVMREVMRVVVREVMHVVARVGERASDNAV